MNKNNLHVAMQNVIENKEQNFEIFYKECKDYAFKIAFGIIKNKEDSEDIVQNLFLKIYKLPKEKLPTKNEASWLYSVVKNETLNYIKQKRKDINIDDLQIYKDDEGISNLINEASYKELMKKLNSEEELIVKLKTESNFTFKEIAKILGKNENTVKWKYYSAIHTLKLFITNLCLFAICLSVVKLLDKNVCEEQINDNGINSQENEINTEDNFIQNSFDTTITDSAITEDEKQEYENNINESQNSEDLNETTQTVENASINTTTKLPLYFLSILFLVFAIIFLIKFVKYQLKRKNKLSK